MQYFTHSEAGHNHNNEDTIVIQTHPHDSSVLLCALADGQGGQFGGGVASQTAAQRCVELAASYPVKKLHNGSSWYEILCSADEAVSENTEAGFTTLIGLCVAGDKVCGASCGDSAVFLVNDKGFKVLTEKQRKNPPVGSGAAFPTAFSARSRNNSQLLITSDGVWRFVGYDTVAEFAHTKQGQELVIALRDLQLAQNGGKLSDDFSLIVVQHT